MIIEVGLARLNHSASHVIIRPNFAREVSKAYSVRRLIGQMEQMSDRANSSKITTERQIASGAPKPEDKQRSSSTIVSDAIQSVDDKDSSHYVRKFTIRLLKQTAKTAESLRMASEGFSAEEARSNDDNQEEDGKGESAMATANSRKPAVATVRPTFAIDKIVSGDSGEVDLKASKAEESTNQANELNGGHSRTFEGQISKARRPDLLPLPLRRESYNRPAFDVTPDEVGNATEAVVPDRVINPFELPVRFRKRIQASTNGSDVGPPMSVFDDVCLEDKEEEAETRRREDMEMALAWIQHEQVSIRVK